ncbi:hypothetical protein C8R44DRAFT_796398 [Mycena epipterygia]|nr:hypothetical protein C8R44DRAFT_796398 [Mycena epipterygia]
MSSTPVFALRGWKTRVSHLSVRACQLVVASRCRYRDACFAFVGLRSRLSRPFLPGSGLCLGASLFGPVVAGAFLDPPSVFAGSSSVLGFHARPLMFCSGTYPCYFVWL